MKKTDEIKELKEIFREIHLLGQSIELLSWDQETNIPEYGFSERADQIALLKGLHHERITSSRVGELLDKVGLPEKDELPENIDASFLRLAKRTYDHSIKLPSALVIRHARQVVLSQQAWAKAKSWNDYSMFSVFLEEIISITREIASCYGYKDHPYDPLIDSYEPYTTTYEVKGLFENIKPELINLVKAISERPEPEANFLEGNFSVVRQKKFIVKVLNLLGFPWERARLDESEHPFTISIGADDVRITTRYNEKQVLGSIFGAIHECGHAMYELGFDSDIQGNILAQGTSLSLHESQSRTWENLIARSFPFSKLILPHLQKSFPNHFDNVDPEQLYRGINSVKPSFIRVDADEVTYNLHIILRFELETALLEGKLEVDQLPAKWSSLMEEYLGIKPDSPKNGVLQDVHWASGFIGYFPTYGIGNMYSAQLFNKLEEQLPDWGDNVVKGDFTQIKDWLNNNIYKHGAAFSAKEICQRVTGRELDASFFIKYLKTKYTQIYKL